MNSTIQTQLEHKTIREFTKRDVPQEILDTLYSIAMRTASSSGLQASSIIRVTDTTLKKELSEICGQEYIARLPEFWLFIVDNYRNTKIAEALSDEKVDTPTMRNFFQSFIDASLMAQSVEITAESLGLGTAFFGSIYNDIDRLIDIFKLPCLTFPVVGLGFGFPNQSPQLKPRIGKGLRVFENAYKSFDNYADEIKEYDEEMKTYYDLRNLNKKSSSFSEVVIKSLTNIKKFDIIEKIKKQGFSV